MRRICLASVFLACAEAGAVDTQPKEPDFATLLLANNPARVRSHGASSVARREAPHMDALSDLQQQAKELNPAIGYYDPLGLSKSEFWGQSNEATIGFLRHSEIKHGRVAMAGFLGYLIHENGIRWPLSFGKFGPPYSELEGLSAPDVWDKCSFFTKFSLIAGIGCFEYWGESKYSVEQFGGKHYMRGGKPGYFPPLKNIPLNGKTFTPPLDFFDPFAFTQKLSAEQKATKLNAEVNNGRLAMLGLMSLISEARVPGAVPALKGVVKGYNGEVMNPFKDVPDFLKVDAIPEKFGKGNKLGLPFNLPYGVKGGGYKGLDVWGLISEGLSGIVPVYQSPEFLELSQSIKKR